MSRTYRKRCEQQDYWWLYYELVKLERMHWEWLPKDRNSSEFKKEIRKYHSDSYRGFREPGPSWHRNLTAQRPYRRKSKQELKKFFNNNLYEPDILSMPKLIYWT